ncbi:hypothetical protein GO496_25690 [Acidovorax citrulli]|nr:hypothetical protein [Paracidovorax citrulli]
MAVAAELEIKGGQRTRSFASYSKDILCIDGIAALLYTARQLDIMRLLVRVLAAHGNEPALIVDVAENPVAVSLLRHVRFKSRETRWFSIEYIDVAKWLILSNGADWRRRQHGTAANEAK